MIALARSSCSRATASSPRVASSACSRERSSPISAGAVSGAGWSSAVARRAQPPMLLTSRAPRRINPPCSISFWVFVRIALSCMSVRRNTDAALSSRRQFTSVTPPIAVRAARLFEQPHLLDFHPPVHRLHHVVDGEQGDGHRRERLHLHSRPPDRLGGGADPHARERLIERGLDLYVVEPQGVTQRDQFRRALRCERAGHLAHRQDIALGHRLIGHEPERLRRHPNRSFGHRGADGDGLVAYVHHPGAAGRVHVRQLHGASPARSSARTAPTSWGFTLPCARPRASSTCAIASTTFSVSRPARASSRSWANRPSSMSVNPPRAWNGCWPSANA